MSTDGPRSSGCWTCRLRKLKCDEDPNHCRRCLRCGISCHGYGPKPAWKDGGLREAEQLAVIKARVADNRRRRARAANTERNESLMEAQIPPPPSQRLDCAEESLVNNEVSESWNHNHGGGPATDEAMLLPLINEMLAGDVDVNLWPSLLSPAEVRNQPTATNMERALTQRWTLLNLTGRENELLRHYLNHVFALQYFHQKYISTTLPSPSWLLSLLETIPPLRHAALSLSALHLHCLQQQKGGSNNFHDGYNRTDTLVELREYHAAALIGLRSFISDYGSSSLTAGYIPILACCSQLISFDLCRGGIDEWYTHVDAVARFILMRAAEFPLLSADEMDSENNEASRFLIGALMWSDILAGVSTGRRPLLYIYLQRLLDSSEQPSGPLIKMEDIMGCENHIMLLISEISALQEWKMNCLKDRSFSTWRLVTRSKVILDDLEIAILRLDRELDAYGLYCSNDRTIYQTKIITGTITNIFACAAVVYLHVVVCGVQPSLLEIRTSVERTITAMQRIQRTDRGKLARGILWPVCVAGCLAEGPKQSFFREFVRAAVDDAIGFGNAQTALDILEHFWAKSSSEKRHTSSSPPSDSPPLEADYLFQGWPQIIQKSGRRVLLV
ncbi:hypothetical protein VE01_08809 [Pseudogymnoascus verrucosus]|uniref:Zn(2)-C6 fungal-type domain-containing protein n=1 Tax=Pseudogymnoascus verrucosus TaxID=342668 RepID=A0A1B8GBN7_9PEZI|nr:uncharacterized protein VE01_08809 [Pseudogymnoascus verrucosus]OBT93244.1 hypothetical protein VE01_08809 [Pseudogymnoascus verrucosus]